MEYVKKKKHTNSTGNLKLGAFYKIELERISELATNLNQAKSHNISVKVIIHEFTYFPLFVPLTLHSQLLYLSEDKFLGSLKIVKICKRTNMASCIDKSMSMCRVFTGREQIVLMNCVHQIRMN